MYNLFPTGFNPATNALGLAGAYLRGSCCRSHLFNHPSFITGPNQFAVEGTQLFISHVPDGVHTVEVSDPTPSKQYAMWINAGVSFITIDNFEVEGYSSAKNNGNAYIVRPSSSDITITNNYIHDLTSQGHQAAIATTSVNNLTVVGNAIGPLTFGGGIGTGGITNLTVESNAINKPGWTAVDVYDATGGVVAFNRISNTLATHAEGVAVYDTGTGHNSDVTVRNNQFDFTQAAITLGGNNYANPPNGNIVIALNVATNSNVAVESWGRNLTGVTIFGNILLKKDTTSASHALTLNVKGTFDIMAINNIVDGLPFGNSGVPPAGWSILGNLVTHQYNFTKYPVASRNIFNPELRASLISALRTPGKLPAFACGVIDQAKAPVRVGIDYSCGP
jgi:hypothetical protein